MEKKNIGKKISAVAFGTGITQVLNFLFGFILVRAVGIDEYSAFKQGSLILTTLSGFLLVFSPVAMSYYLGKRKGEDERYAYIVITAAGLFAVSAACMVVMYVLRVPIAQAYANPLLQEYLWVFCISILCDISSAYYTYYMVAENKSRHMAVVISVFAFFRTLSLVISLIIPQGSRFGWFMALYAVAEVLKLLYIWGETWFSIRGKNFHVTKVQVVEILKFSVPLLAMSIINALNNNLDKNLVAFLYNDPVQYAVYANGTFEVPFISILNTSIITVMLPEIASRFRADDQSTKDGIIVGFRGIIHTCGIILIPLLATLFLFSTEVIVFLFTDKFSQSAPLFRIYVFMLIFKMLNLGVLLTAADKQREIIKAGIFMILANAILVFSIYRFATFDALPLAPLLATVVMNISLLLSIRKVYGQHRVLSVIPFRALLKVALVCLPVMTAFALLRNLVSVGGTLALVPMAVCYVLSVAAAILTDKSARSAITKRLR